MLKSVKYQHNKTDTDKLQTITSSAVDADGIYYDKMNDVLYQLNRTENVINAYSNVSSTPTLTATSTSDFINGREIAVKGDKLVVAQDANDANGGNAFYIYTISPTSITLDKKYDTDINLWGIHADGNRLKAIIDNSNQLAVFDNFFSNPEGSITPSKVISVAGLNRTHGLTYSPDEDLVILTDIGEASSAGDGALVLIKNFSQAALDNTISASEQVRVSGGTSMLGNPVDVAYDSENRMVYVAERAKNGGMILGFRRPTLTGGIAPTYKKAFPGASAINFGSSAGDPCNLISGGMVALEEGGTETTIMVDGVADEISFTSTVFLSDEYSFTYVVTDSDGKILGIPGGNTVDFDPAGVGVCRVYGLTYTGNLNITMGDNLFAAGLEISDACFDLSSNALSINRIDPCADIDGGMVALAIGGTETTIFIDKKGKVRKIHTGFSGPATGSYYEEYVDEFNSFMNTLINE